MTHTIAVQFEQLSPEQAALVNQTCDVFEKGCRGSGSQTIDDVLNSIDESIRLVVLHELVLIEMHYKHPKPNLAQIDSYCQRFEDLDRAWLSEQLGIQPVSMLESTLPVHDAWSDLQKKQAENQSAELLGKFQLLKQLGSGGMGVVYLARQTDLNRLVAVKTLTKVVAQNSQARSRFRAEVESVAQLQHPHIVQIYEVGMDGKTPYYSMEYASGGNLADLAREHPLAPKIVARLAVDIALAIQHSHECGVIHRDLKPANILLAASVQQDGVLLERIDQATGEVKLNHFEPKIADFGLAKRLHADNQETLQGAALGTPSYMSTEQAAGAPNIGPATDIYSLGAVMYDMLVGRPPFLGATPAETIQQVMHDEPVPIRGIQPDVPVDLETICLKCLRKDPDKRYGSAKELAEDLRRFLEGRPILARRASIVERLGKAMKRHPAWTALLIALTFGFIGTTWQWRIAEANRLLAENNAIESSKAHQSELRERERLQESLYAHDITLSIFEQQSNHVRRARELLELAPEHLRNWEWNYVKQRIENACQELSSFDMAAKSVSISPDGSIVAGCSGVWGQPDQGEIRVWDRASGKLLWSARQHPGAIMDLEMDGTGSKLLSCGARFQRGKLDGGVTLWDARTGKVLWQHENSDAQAAMICADNLHCVVGTTSGAIVVRDLTSGAIVRQWQAHKDYVSDLSMWRDGKCLLSTSRDGLVKIWDFERESLLTEFAQNSPERVTCSIDGRSFAVCSHHGDLKCFEWIEGNLEPKLAMYLGERVGALKYSADGQYLIASAMNQTIKLIDVQANRTVREFYGHNGNTLAVSQSEDGCFLASSGFDGTVNVWNLAQPPNTMKHAVGGPFIADIEFLHNSRHVAMAMSPNPGNRAKELAVKIWDVHRSRFLHHLQGHTDWLTSLAVHHGEKLLLSGSLDRTAKMWSQEEWKELHSFGPHDSPVVDVAFANDNCIVTAEENGTIWLWNRESGEAVTSWKIPDRHCKRLACQANGDLIAVSGEAGTIWIYRVGEDKPVREISSNTSLVTELTWSIDGKRLSASRIDSTIDLWSEGDLLNESELLTPVQIQGHTGAVNDICFSPDGQRLVSCGVDRSVRIWNANTGNVVFSLPNVGLNGRFGQVAFSPDGKTVLYSDQNQAESWTSDPISIDYAQWHSQQATIAQRSGNWQGAAIHRRANTQLLANDERAFVQYGNALAETGQFAEAITAYEKAAILRRSDRSFASDDYALCRLLQHEGRTDQSKQLLREMLSRNRDSKDATTLNTSAWAFALDTSQQSLDEVVLLAERANVTKRREFLNTLGAIYLRVGRTSEAIEALQQSIAMEPKKVGSPFDWLFLALAHAKNGNQQESAKWLHQTEVYLQEQQKSKQPASTSWLVRFEIESLLKEVRSNASDPITAP